MINCWLMMVINNRWSRSMIIYGLMIAINYARNWCLWLWTHIFHHYRRWSVILVSLTRARCNIGGIYLDDCNGFFLALQNDDCIYLYLYTEYVNMCVYIYISLYVRIWRYIYIYIYTCLGTLKYFMHKTYRRPSVHTQQTFVFVQFKV